MNLPRELDFLEQHLNNQYSPYMEAEWLISPFQAPIWKYDFDFSRGPQELNWNVRLSNGSSLISPENSKLLNSLRHWLIASTVPYRSGLSNSIKVQYADFNRTLNLIDYLIMNDELFKISRYGLAALSADDLKAIVHLIAGNPRISESLFNWSKRLAAFAKNLLDDTDHALLEFELAANEALSVVSSDDLEEAKSLGLIPSSLPLLRAALKVNGFINQNRTYGYAPNSSKISRTIYQNTLRVKNVEKPTLPCLCYSATKEIHIREYESVEVTTGTGETISQVVFNRYVSCLYKMGTLHELEHKAPIVDDLLSMKNTDVLLKTMGRFRTLPAQLVFDCVKNAIEFHFDHGREILDGYLRLALCAKTKDCLIRDLSEEEFLSAIGPKLQALGVKELDLDSRIKTIGSVSDNEWISRPEHFASLRANKWLLPLVRIYFGAVQLVVGALTARRVGELKDLNVGDALDGSEAWIVFQLRKSTRSLMGIRTTEARPIEPIAAKMIREIERFQKILNRISLGDTVSDLFSPPSTRGLNHRLTVSTYTYNRNLDEFCDYFETALNTEGKRYYIRQHQLRRFFALLFFYSNSFGGLETLQWMLGHTDLRHVWHYITESMTGDVLRGAKSQYIAETLHHDGGESFKNLAQLLKERHGTDDFTLLDTEELEDYVSELLEEGEIEIEPEFFTDSEGEKFKVIVKIHENRGSQS